MSGPVVMLAKFVPDMLRMEPKNIGVIIWDDGRVAHRFLGESEKRITPPKGVPDDSRHAYREWVRYWRIQLTRSHIRLADGTEVSRDSPEFVHALATKSKPGFMLVECARMHESLNGTLAAAADEFFSRLVQPIGKTQKRRRHFHALRKRCNSLFRDAGISGNPEYYHRGRHVVSRLGDAWQDFPFDYYLGEDDVPRALFQRVLLDVPRSVSSTGWMFQWVQEAPAIRLPKNRCGIFVDTGMHDLGDNFVEGSLLALSRVGQLIDLKDYQSAVSRIQQMASVG